MGLDCWWLDSVIGSDGLWPGLLVFGWFVLLVGLVFCDFVWFCCGGLGLLLVAAGCRCAGVWCLLIVLVVFISLVVVFIVCAGRLITLWVFDVGCGLLDLICGCASCALVGLFALFVVSLILGLVRAVGCGWRGFGFVAWFCGLLVGVSVCLNVVCCVFCGDWCWDGLLFSWFDLGVFPIGLGGL